jgi:hypothetical protein
MSESFECLMPDFFDKDAIRVPEKTYRIDNQGQRLYARMVGDELRAVPSVTTILREMPTPRHLIEWYCTFPTYEDAQKYVAERAEYGTFMHILFKQLLMGETLVFDATHLADSFELHCNSLGVQCKHFDFKQHGKDLKQDLYAFVLWCSDYNVKPLAMEYIVFGEKYAGAADLVCKMTISKDKTINTYCDERMFCFIPTGGTYTEETEIIVLVDFKSGRKQFHDSHVLQLHALREQWNIEQPDLQIDVIANYGCKDYRLPIGKSEPYNYKDQSKNAQLFKRWPLLVEMYHLDPIVIKDRVEFADAMPISLKSDLSKFTVKTDVTQKLMEEYASTNLETDAANKVA